MINIEKFFTSEYLFDPSPSAESKFYLPLLIFFGVMIVFGLIVKFFLKNDLKLSKRYFTAAITCGILGYLYIFSRYESLPWLGTRFFLLLVGLTSVIWFLIINIWSFRHIPKRKEELTTKERFEKYLPKSKRN